jgi:hypothetical protein
MRAPSLLVLVLGGFAAALSHAAPAQVLYALNPASADQQRLPEWLRSGAWAPPVNVLDYPTNAALGRAALFLEATTYGGGTNSRLVGDTSIRIQAGKRYQLSFLLQRTQTLKEADQLDQAPYYSGLVYQLWAGHPENGGALVGEARALPYAIDEVPQNVPLTLVSTVIKPELSGSLFIRFSTEVSPAPRPDAYQQAELYDVQVTEVR